MLGGLREDLVCIRTQVPHKRLSQTCLWVLSAPMEAQVSRGLLQGQGLWVQHTWEAWHVSPTTKPLSRQPTNWRTIIPKKFLHCCKSSRTYNRFPSLGIRQRDWELSGNLTFKANGIWLQNFHRTGDTDSWRARTRACAYQDPGERKSDPLQTEPDLAVSVQESPAKMWVNSGLPWGQRHWTVLAYVLLKEVTITLFMNQGKLEVDKKEMARVNINILGISELKWMGMGEFNSDDHYLLPWARIP